MGKCLSGYLEHEDKYTVLEPHGSFYFYCSKRRLQVSVILLVDNPDRGMLFSLLVTYHHVKIH